VAPAPAAALPGAPYAGAVDAVWTYVTDADAAWRAARAAAEAATGRGLAPRNRFRDWGELRFSMRSAAAAMPWLRDFIVVVADAAQVPPWLDAGAAAGGAHAVRVVFHAPLFAAAGAADALPTFNSLAIEGVLHHIPGVSDEFLYLNNDVFVVLPTPLAFFRTAGAYRRWGDWPLHFKDKACAALVKGARRGRGAAPAAPPPAGAALYARCRATQPFFWDALVAAAHWGAPPTRWAPHMPHLWSVAGLRAVEAELATELAVARRNRLRDAATDVSPHLQLEAHRAAAALDGARRPGAVDVVATHATTADLFFAVFSNNVVNASARGGGGGGGGGAPPLPAAGAAFASAEAALQGGRATPPVRFLGLEDDLVDPSAAVVAFWRGEFTALLAKTWPVAGAWERPLIA